MIKLFYAPGTCALAPHIVLEWIAEPYELQRVKPSDPEYLKINPLGQVPAMIDGDSGVMNQADAILKYLAHKYPDVKLGDDGTLQDAYDLDRWLYQVGWNKHSIIEGSISRLCIAVCPNGSP